MSAKTPPKWFDKQDPNVPDADEQRRLKSLLHELPKLLEQRKDRGRADRFEPYLLIRSVLGDRGDRPINIPFWESPDIWTAPGKPELTPAVPPSHGGTVVVGQPNTVYAHVWNVGLAPLAGVRVEFYWFNPSLAIDGAHRHDIGHAVCELAARGMPGSHKLVKCTKPWIPELVNGGHECLVARVSGLGDPIGNNEWSPWLNRHVGQRNVTVLPAGATASRLIESLNETRPPGTHLQLIQVGEPQGKLAVSLVAPNQRVSRQITTQLLGEINALGQINRTRINSAPAGLLAPVHPLAHGVENVAPVLHQPGDVAVIDPLRVLGHLRRAERQEYSEHKTHLVDLLGAVGRLNGGGEGVGTPHAGEAHMLRVACYAGEQLVGGYTIVIGTDRK